MAKYDHAAWARTANLRQMYLNWKQDDEGRLPTCRTPALRAHLEKRIVEYDLQITQLEALYPNVKW